MRDPLNPRLPSQSWPRLAWAFAACLVALPCMAATTCTTSATSVAFGVYNPLSGTPNNTTGSVSVRCQMVGSFSDRVDYTVELSTGSSGSYVNRTLRSGTNPLNYNLYVDTTLTQVWGTDAGSTSARTGRIDLRWWSPTMQNDLTIYGSIPAAQYNVVPGIYSDTIVVTVTY